MARHPQWYGRRRRPRLRRGRPISQPASRSPAVPVTKRSPEAAATTASVADPAPTRSTAARTDGLAGGAARGPDVLVDTRQFLAPGGRVGTVRRSAAGRMTLRTGPGSAETSRRPACYGAGRAASLWGER